DRIVVALPAGGGDPAAVQRRRAARVGGERGKRCSAADGTAEGRRARGVDREPERAVERAAETDVARAGARECRAGAERDRVVVALRPGGGDRTAVDLGRAGRVRGQRGERRRRRAEVREGRLPAHIDGERDGPERVGEIDVEIVRGRATVDGERVGRMLEY